MNDLQKMKELIEKINAADEAYFKNDSPIMTDREYDALVLELKMIERITGIHFSNSPIGKVPSDEKVELKTVRHSKPMLSCNKTKSVGDIIKFVSDTDTYALTQEEDIFSTAYEFVVKSNPNIASCEYYCNGAWNAAEKKAGNFVIMLDFEKRIEKVKFTFSDNLADDYIFTVNYTEADKDAYYQKQAEIRRNTYIEAAQIKHSTGADLVNIYFQPCCPNCGKTEIELWIAKGEYAPHHGSCVTFYTPKLTGGTPEQMIAKFSVEEGFLFKAINGLANGVYAYRVRQFSKDNEMLFESDYQFFDIRPQGTGRPMGRVNRI